MERSLHKFGILALHTLIWTLPLGLGIVVLLDVIFPDALMTEIRGVLPLLPPFEQPSVSQRFYFQVAVTTVALVYFSGCLLAGRLHIPRSPVLGAGLLFGAAAILSSLNARSTMHTLREVTYLCSAILLLGMVVHLRPSRLEGRRLVVSLVLAAALAAVPGVMQYRGIHLEFGDADLAQQFNGGRFSVRSVLGHPNYLAVFVGSVLFLGLGLLAGLRTRWARVVLGAGATALGVCVIVAGSRSIWLATLLVGGGLIATSAPIWRKVRLDRRAWAGVALVALFLALFAIPNPVVPRRYSFTARLLSARPVEGRLYFYFATTRMIAQNPILGFGYNNYGMEFWDQAAAIQAQPNNRVFSYILEDMGGVRPDQAHNEYLQIAAETGVLGLAAFFLLIVVFFRQLRRGHVEMDNPADRLMLAGMGGAVAVVLIDCMFSFPLRLPWSTLVFWLILGLGSVYAWSGRALAPGAPPAALTSELGPAPKTTRGRSGRKRKRRSK